MWYLFKNFQFKYIRTIAIIIKKGGREREREREKERERRGLFILLYIIVIYYHILLLFIIIYTYIIIWSNIVISNIRIGFCCNIISYVYVNFYILFILLLILLLMLFNTFLHYNVIVSDFSRFYIFAFLHIIHNIGFNCKVSIHKMKWYSYVMFDAETWFRNCYLLLGEKTITYINQKINSNYIYNLKCISWNTKKYSLEIFIQIYNKIDWIIFNKFH